MHFYVIGEKASDVDCLNKADKQECCTVWNFVVDIAQKSNLSLPVQEQWIIVSSLVFAVFDAMVKEVKEKKINDNLPLIIYWLYSAYYKCWSGENILTTEKN